MVSVAQRCTAPGYGHALRMVCFVASILSHTRRAARALHFSPLSSCHRRSVSEHKMHTNVKNMKSCGMPLPRVDISVPIAKVCSRRAFVLLLLGLLASAVFGTCACAGGTLISVLHHKNVQWNTTRQGEKYGNEVKKIGV